MTGFVKDPDATLDYGFDWSRWLQPNETISSSEWIVPDDLNIVDSTFDTFGQTVVWLSGGQSGGRPYKITNRITTNSSPVPRVEDRSFTLRIREK